jgi:hypothetical protein
MVDGLASFLIYCGLIVLTLYLHTSVLPFGSFGQPDLVLVRGDAVSSAAFWSCHILLFVLSLGSEETCCRWKAGVAATEKDQKLR